MFFRENHSPINELTRFTADAAILRFIYRNDAPGICDFSQPLVLTHSNITASPFNAADATTLGTLAMFHESPHGSFAWDSIVPI